MSPERRRRFHDLAKVHSLVRNERGDPATVRIRRASPKATPKVVQAAVLLAENGTTMLRAIRAVERMIDDNKADIDLERVSDVEALKAGLARLGIAGEFRPSGKTV